MGYLGFGLNKWVYKQRPRKPFKRRELKTADEIDRFERSFKLRDNEEARDSKLKAFGTLIIIMVVLSIAGYLIFRMYAYNNEFSKAVEQTRISNNVEAIDFLQRSASYNIEIGEYEKAASDLELILNIDPRHLSANYNYAVVLIKLCETDTIYCALAKEQLTSAIGYYPENAAIIKLSEDFKSKNIYPEQAGKYWHGHQQ